MTSNEQNDFVDRVAQAVIDRIEERSSTERLVSLVAARVVELQREEAEKRAALDTEAAQAEAGATNKEVEG